MKVKVYNGDRVRREIDVAEGTTVRECVRILEPEHDDFQTPTLCMMNGEPLLRKDGGWDVAMVDEAHAVFFVELPLGGGGGGSDGSMIVQLITSIAAFACSFIPVVGPFVAAGIMIVGTLIASAMAPKPQGQLEQESAAQASPTYSINASGNMARMFQPEPEGFGKMRIVPDYVAQSFSEYSSNDQYGYFLYGIGRGEYQVHQLYFGESMFWQNGGFTTTSGLATEDGEEYSRKINVALPVGDAWTSAYPAVASGAQARTLRLSVNFPEGYGIESHTHSEGPSGDHDYYSDDTYSFTGMTATVLIQYAEIDDSGAVIGEWSSTITKTMKSEDRRSWGWNASSYAFSKTVSVKAPRYARWAVRVKNGSEAIVPPASTSSSDEVMSHSSSTSYTAHETMKLASVGSNALSCSVQICSPGERVTLFPTNITTNQDLSGVDVFAPNDEDYPSGNDGWTVAYAANDPGTETTQIKLDYVYASGLGRYKENGGLESYSVDVTVQYVPINSTGNPTGSWATLGTWTDTAKTTTPQRKTRSFKVAAGRYSVRMKRTSNTHKNAERTPSLDQLQWVGLRAVLPGQLTFPQSTVAVKIKASNALSQSGASNFSLVATRKLPIYNRSTDTWSEPQATRKWAAAVSAVCQESWGGGLSDSQIDLDTLWAIGARLDAKGWHCDCYIDGAYNLWQLITEMCQMVCVVPRLTGTVLSFVEDEPGRAVSYELNARNIVRGSFQVTYATWTDDTPDDVIINYMDEDANYQQRDVQATLPQSESIEPTTLDWIGITNRTHAYRVATRYAAMNRWRRVTVTCQVEALGRLMQIGDVASVNHPRFRTTQSGVVTGWNATALTLQIESDFSSEHGSESYISLTRPNGRVWGPVKLDSIANGTATLNAADYSAYLLQGNSAPFGWLKDGTTSQPTCYALHASNQFQRRMLVQSVAADDLWHYQLTLVNDAPEVAQYDTLPVPAWNGRAQTNITLKEPKNLRVKYASATGIATVTWSAVRGATSYEVQHSADGLTWIHDGFTTATKLVIVDAEAMNWSGNANADTAFVRVAAISASSRSDWAEWPEED